MSQVDMHVEALSRDGYCVIENAFSGSFCDEALSAMHRIERELAQGGAAESKTVRIMNLLQYDDLFQEIPVNASFLPVIERYLDEECLLSGIEGVEIHPGETGQGLHTDTWWHDDHRFAFPACVNTVLTLVDFTAENGATRVVPGSHLWTAEELADRGITTSFFQSSGGPAPGHDASWTPVAVEAPKGSMILWDARILHGAGANESAASRPSVISPYILGWMRQLDNFAYGIPSERARDFSPRLQRLIGLECFRKFYSQVNNMSPREWLWGRGELEMS